MVRNRMMALVLAAGLSVVAAPAQAALEASAADGFLVKHTFDLAKPPAEAWAEIAHPERWWPPDHTWSGDAKALSAKVEPGGCWCERWKDGFAEHARVVMAMPGRMFRLNGALGPLQALAVEGVLDVQLEAAGTGTKATVTYRVSGDSSHKLAEFAPVVDQVVGIQWGRWARFVSTGSPDDPTAKPAGDAPAVDDATGGDATR